MAIMQVFYYIYELLVFCVSTIADDLTLHHGIMAFIIANAALFPCIRLKKMDDNNDLNHMTWLNPDPTPRIVYRFYGVNLVLIGGLIAVNAMDQLRWTVSALLISHGCTYMWLYRTRHFNEQPSVISPILSDGAKLVGDCSTLASELQSKSPGLNLNVSPPFPWITSCNSGLSELNDHMFPAPGTMSDLTSSTSTPQIITPPQNSNLSMTSTCDAITPPVPKLTRCIAVGTI